MPFAAAAAWQPYAAYANPLSLVRVAGMHLLCVRIPIIVYPGTSRLDDLCVLHAPLAHA
jgi:hypothetical protein